MAESHELMEKVISLCKRRGFIFQGSEIYGGLAGTWDYGPMGTLLKENIKALWLKMFRDSRDDMYGLDAAIIMNPKVWEASGHVAGFSDPMVVCSNCAASFRADHLEDPNVCPSCGKKGTLGAAKQFNMMFETKVGAGEQAMTSYLRPETAQGIFVNFKNVVDSFHPKLPFGIAQIGKAFRNEIAPRDFIFRLRELEQMEVEYFVHPDNWKPAFDEWQKAQLAFADAIGLDRSRIKQVDIPEQDRAHYSKHSVDTEFVYPFGQKELWGLAYRTDYDLAAHAASSGQDLSVTVNDETGEKIVPHVIEPSMGVDRTVLAVLLSAYAEDEQNGETRSFLKLPKLVAPVKAAVFPLLKNKPELVAKAREVLAALRKITPHIAWDDNGNIGKRYRRQDEIGTPVCITIDFDTLGETPELKDTVTVRDRDTGEQKRVKIEDLKEVLS